MSPTTIETLNLALNALTFFAFTWLLYMVAIVVAAQRQTAQAMADLYIVLRDGMQSYVDDLDRRGLRARADKVRRSVTKAAKNAEASQGAADSTKRATGGLA